MKEIFIENKSSQIALQPSDDVGDEFDSSPRINYTALNTSSCVFRRTMQSDHHKYKTTCAVTGTTYSLMLFTHNAHARTHKHTRTHTTHSHFYHRCNIHCAMKETHFQANSGSTMTMLQNMNKGTLNICTSEIPISLIFHSRFFS